MQQQEQQQQQLINELATQQEASQEQLFQQMTTQLGHAPSPSLGAAGGGAGDGLGGLPVCFSKMGPGDDPEAFLVTFERVATAIQWPHAHWAIILAPYLTGAVQATYRNLDPPEALDYSKVKAAILDQTGISPETYHQRLCREQYMLGARPRVMAQRIHDLCWRWLEPEH